MDMRRIDPNCAAIVLAGGKSSRMGSSKALLPIDGEPLIVHIVRALRQLFDEIVIVGTAQVPLPALPEKLICDEVPYQGPLAGLYYGLRAISGQWSFICSCDAPFLDLSLVAHLVSCVQGYDVVVPFWEERFQPLSAVYRRELIPVLKQQLTIGELRFARLYEKVPTRVVREEELRRFDPEGLSFFNLNRPEDYHRALALWHKRGQLRGDLKP